ncbi:hypothetical protein BUALT_Bualt17G0045500 [Buddleja alternifolia]|uniref:Uncharacterized protein n=1 Tax=Buddleja alternifolia TaxID=168488 RepID=A0AAV6WGQ6_9LAMI|nr:hypothetical protein BUALT_Bualt17G0045500 [Buddleja alternifolia]
MIHVWELAWRFLDVLGLGQPFSFQELELELVSPWSDGYPFNSVHGTVDIGDSAPRIEKDSQARFNGLLLAKILGSLLKLLVSELLSKAAAYVCPNFDGGESKSRRGKRKDLDCLAALKKIKLDMLPVNGLTWHEIARRHILAVLSMEGNLDSTEIASRESGKVFHCLRGDGGILCDSLTGVAALEGDAVVLQDAMKEIFGSLKSKNEIVTVFEGESDDKCAPTVEVNDGVIPEWAQVLEPVRKLPTNVGARIRRCINEALEKNPPEWAKKILEHSISKEVYKGNASGPTKRAVISVLASVTPEKPQQKAEKKEKVKVKTNVTDLITKQCRIVLRRAAAADEDRVFCNLLGRIILKPNDNDDEGLLGYPAMVSRPLDFRTIDLRLAAGAYGGSHEAFIDDVREVWRNIRTAYGDRSDLIDVAESLSQKFEDLYEKEVLALVHKIDEISNANDSSADALKERDDLLADVGKSSLPRAPWEEGICKVCGMDKDDDNVLLCDKCDSEYHRYCLNPPLLRIPEGNWYCPSCVAGQSISFLSVANQSRKRRYQGEFTRKFLEELARLANLMEMKEYWEFTVEERVFFMKFLFDEALNSATIRDHMDQSATRAADLQQKLKSLTSELKLLKVKEEMFGLSAEKANSGVCNIRGDLKSDASSALLNTESSSRGKSSEKGSHLLPFSGFTKPEDGPSINEQVDYNRQPFWPPSSSTSAADTFSQSQHENIVAHAQLSRNDIFAHGQHLGTIKNDISNLQDSIASIELELLKVSLRKDFLGRDANGRVYWAFHCRGARPWIIANGSLESKQKLREEFASVPGSDNWMYYESYDEIEKLVGWLKENNVRERELKESISQLLSNKLKDSEYTEKHILSKGGSNPSIFSSGRKTLLPDFLSTKAMAALEKRFGPRQQIYRCECLELLWPYNDHCPSCHQNFPTNEELKEHSKENCKAATSVSKKRQTTEDVSKSKKSRNVASQENRIGNVGDLHILMSEKQKDEAGFSERYQKPDCPFKLEDIMARFVVPSSVKDAVNGIGLIGNGGIPSFLPRRPHYISDPALSLGPTRINESGSTGMPTDLIRQQQQHSKGPSAVDRMMDNTVSNRLSRSGEKGLAEGPAVERLKSILTSERGRVKDKSSLLGLSRSSIVRESSLRPLQGRAFEVLRFLKINLLDMDAALPEDALRMSRSNQERRCLWRAFVKSAKSIYEVSHSYLSIPRYSLVLNYSFFFLVPFQMVQATIILEDAIKTEYLTNDWWYWSSPSTAAKITTLSALALRLYALDSAISYEKPLPSTTTEILEPNCAIDEDLPLANPSSPQLQKTPEPENPRTRSRTSKRRKDMNS